MRIVQITAEQSAREVKREARTLAALFRGMGLESQVHELNKDEPAKELKKQIYEDDVLLLHFDMTPFPRAPFEHPRERTCLLLHDYVDISYNFHYSQTVRQDFALAREQLHEMASTAPLSIAHVNKGVELLSIAGARRVRKIPLALDPQSLAETPDRFTSQLFPASQKRIVCCAEADSESGLLDLYKTLWYLNNFTPGVEDTWQLVVAGNACRCESYISLLKKTIGRFEIPQFQIVLTGVMELTELNALLDSANVYASFDYGDLRGEGVLRAIHRGIPVIGVSDAASEDILGESNSLIIPLIHSSAAERIVRLESDEPFRQECLASQRRRLENCRPRALTFLWNSVLSRFSQTREVAHDAS